MAEKILFLEETTKNYWFRVINEKKATKKKLHEEDLFSLSAPIDYWRQSVI